MNFSNRSLLNKTFLADGVYSLAVGAVLILAAAPLASLFGPAATPALLKLLGVGLVFWGIFHLSAARNGGPVATAARVSIAGDVLWLAASLALLVAVYPSLSVYGIGFIVIGLITVTDFLVYKLRGLTRERAAIA
ncbi:hypothetical protein [Ensifer sp.]|uniref:hypothetical protein n=1 Tax=Ensifer sp. TaxID=1872086 RepID=UPI002E13F4BE|nr:hypothetical protein [Ensifer sp.]